MPFLRAFHLGWCIALGAPKAHTGLNKFALRPGRCCSCSALRTCSSSRKSVGAPSRLGTAFAQALALREASAASLVAVQAPASKAATPAAPVAYPPFGTIRHWPLQHLLPPLLPRHRHPLRQHPHCCWQPLRQQLWLPRGPAGHRLCSMRSTLNFQCMTATARALPASLQAVAMSNLQF